ncbi:MAG: hypothetical protein ACRD21_17145 [Vicinamibacteria bacterium]
MIVILGVDRILSMSYLSTVLVALSLAALTLVFVHRGVRDGNLKGLALHLGAVAAALFFLHWFFDFPGARPIPRPRGDQSHHTVLVVVLYTCMLLGMLAQYAFKRFESPKARRKKFDLGVFLAPVFASPVIFIPLLAALQKVELDFSRIDAAAVMVFFVAFQNGFFWKEYFDHRSQSVSEMGR